MKNFTKIIALFVFVGMSYFSNAQQIPYVYPTATSSINTCDGSATVIDSSSASWNWYNSNLQLIQTGGNNISNLCEGTYYFVYTNSFYSDTLIFDINNPCTNFNVFVGQHESYDSLCNGDVFPMLSGGTQPFSYLWNTGQTTSEIYNLCPGDYSVTVTDANGCTAFNGAELTDSTLNVNCQDFYAYAYSTQLSSPNACDGSAYTSVQGGTAPYSYLWDNGQTSSQIGNLCAGILNLTVTDANGCAFTSATVITADSSTNWNYALSGYVYTTSPSMDGLCDGTAYVDVYGGIAPYTFVHSNGDVTQSPVGLCAGIYSVIVTDADSSTITLNYVVADPSDVFYGGNYNDSTIVDTLGMAAIEDCMIDYLTLDTAFVSDIAYISNDSIVVTWSVIDGNGTINFLQSYTISAGLGVYDLILQIYCPQKSSTNYVYAHDQIFFNPALAIVTELTENDFNVYPNPFANTLKIDMEENTKSDVNVVDITGKLIYNSTFGTKNIVIDLEGLSKGQYFLTVTNNGVQKTQIIVKQ